MEWFQCLPKTITNVNLPTTPSLFSMKCLHNITRGYPKYKYHKNAPKPVPFSLFLFQSHWPKSTFEKRSVETMMCSMMLVTKGTELSAFKYANKLTRQYPMASTSYRRLLKQKIFGEDLSRTGQISLWAAHNMSIEFVTRSKIFILLRGNGRMVITTVT